MEAQAEKTKPKMRLVWRLKKKKEEDTLEPLLDHVRDPWSLDRVQEFLQGHGYDLPTEKEKAQSVLQEARVFSSTMNVILEGLADQNLSTPEVKQALRLLSSQWLNGPAQLNLAVTPDARSIEARLRWVKPNSVTPQGFFSQWQRDQAHQLMEGLNKGLKIRRCAAKRCGKFFVDKTMPGNTRYCSEACKRWDFRRRKKMFIPD
jgi:predicted RNA-binding Zn ribbon-like protein